MFQLNLLEKKRILFFIDWYYPAFKAGGPISSVRNLCLQLKEEYEILVVTSDRDLGDSKSLTGIALNKIVTVEGINVIYLTPDQVSATRFKQIADEFKPNVIHLNSLFSAHFTILPLKIFKEYSCKIVISPRGMFGKESLKIKPIKKKLFFKYAKCTSLFSNVIWHATSEQEAKEIKFKIGTKAKIGIANNVPYLPSSIVDIPKKKFGELIMFSVGRIAPIKNIDFLLESLKQVKSNIVLNIIGPEEDQSYFQSCQAIVKQLNENIKVNFLGGLSPLAINELYSDQHIFVTASKNENFGHSIAEALGSGRPVIVSDKTPWKELEKIGAGFDLPLDQKKFAEKIEYFASLNQEEFNEFCNNARDKAIEIADPASSIANYKALYNL